MTHTDNANELAKLILETWGSGNALEAAQMIVAAQKAGVKNLDGMGLPPMIG